MIIGQQKYQGTTMSSSASKNQDASTDKSRTRKVVMIQGGPNSEGNMEKVWSLTNFREKLPIYSSENTKY